MPNDQEREERLKHLPPDAVARYRKKQALLKAHQQQGQKGVSQALQAMYPSSPQDPDRNPPKGS